MLEIRSQELERIDTGDYTTGEYERFLREIRLVNRLTGDLRTLRKTLFRSIENHHLNEFSVLDVGAGSGEMLAAIRDFADKTGRKAHLTGLDLNEISARTIAETAGIDTVRADAFRLPFEDGAFDYAMCSLFTHHLRDTDVITVLHEMKRVSRRAVFVIDLHRSAVAVALYKIFCAVFRISPLVREDGTLSIKRSFRPGELLALAERAGLDNAAVERRLIYRLVLSA